MMNLECVWWILKFIFTSCNNNDREWRCGKSNENFWKQKITVNVSIDVHAVREGAELSSTTEDDASCAGGRNSNKKVRWGPQVGEWPTSVIFQSTPFTRQNRHASLARRRSARSLGAADVADVAIRAHAEESLVRIRVCSRDYTRLGSFAVEEWHSSTRRIK